MLDVLIIEKDENGDVEAMELNDLAELGDLRKLETELAEILAEDDIAHLAAAMEPGSVAAALIWENTWAAPFGSAVRHAGGKLVANGRIPIQAIVASLEADAAIDEEGWLTCRLGPGRRGRRASSADRSSRTAAVVGTAAVVAPRRQPSPGPTRGPSTRPPLTVAFSVEDSVRAAPKTPT